MSAEKPLIERLQEFEKVVRTAVDSHHPAAVAKITPEQLRYLAALLEEAAAALKPQPSPLYLAYKEQQKNCSHAGRARIIALDGQVAVCPDCGDGLPE